MAFLLAASFAFWTSSGLFFSQIASKNDLGYSHFPGNTNTLVFKLPEYYSNLSKTGGVIPEFVNPKYANAEKTVFKSATRLECMM